MGEGKNGKESSGIKIVFYATCFFWFLYCFFVCLPLLLLALGALCTFLGVLLALLERARRLIARGVLWKLDG